MPKCNQIWRNNIMSQGKPTSTVQKIFGLDWRQHILSICCRHWSINVDQRMQIVPITWDATLWQFQHKNIFPAINDARRLKIAITDSTHFVHSRNEMLQKHALGVGIYVTSGKLAKISQKRILSRASYTWTALKMPKNYSNMLFQIAPGIRSPIIDCLQYTEQC